MNLAQTLIDVFGVEPAFLALFGVTAFVGFFASSLFGVGGAIALMPVLMLRLSPAQAVALAAPVMLFNNGLKLLVFRRHLDVRGALLVCATALPAAAVGALFVSVAPERALKAAIGGLIVLSLVVGRVFHVELKVPSRALPLWGVAIGVASGMCGAAGPPTAVALRGYGLVKEGFVATVAMLAVGLQLVKVPTYLATGVLSVSLLPLAGLLSLSSLLAVTLARRIVGRLDAERFRLILDGLLGAMAVWLLWQVV